MVPTKHKSRANLQNVKIEGKGHTTTENHQFIGRNRQQKKPLKYRKTKKTKI